MIYEYLPTSPTLAPFPFSSLLFFDPTLSTSVSINTCIKHHHRILPRPFPYLSHFTLYFSAIQWQFPFFLFGSIPPQLDQLTYILLYIQAYQFYLLRTYFYLAEHETVQYTLSYMTWYDSTWLTSSWFITSPLLSLELSSSFALLNAQHGSGSRSLCGTQLRLNIHYCVVLRRTAIQSNVHVLL